MEALFDEVSLGNLTLKNRTVRSATWEGLCTDDGEPTEKLASLYDELVDGNVGLIITGYSFVKKEGKQNPWKMGVYDDSLTPSLKSLADRVKERGGAIALQIVHAGGQANREHSESRPIAPSAVSFPAYTEIPKEMSIEEIEGAISAFGDAAYRAKEAGFNAVQLHGAHGYLISQFLSPLTNEREDEYGGSLVNRARFLKNTLRSVREKVGDEYPVLIKMNSDDFLLGGFTSKDCLKVLSMLEDEGMTGVELSGGTAASGERTPARSGINSPEKEAYHREYAAAAKKVAGIPIILVGGVRSPEVISEINAGAGADLFSMSRPLIREPGLIKRWEDGDLERARCISCNGCFLPAMKGEGIRCVVEKPT